MTDVDREKWAKASRSQSVGNDASFDAGSAGDGQPDATAPATQSGTESRGSGIAIETRGLVKRFGKMAALNGLDLQVPRGSVYALLGRNGAGKSTLIQILLGLLEPTRGEVSVLGLDPVKDGTDLRRRVGYIPERLPMYDWMTVDQTIRLVAGLHSDWDKEIEASLLRRFRIPHDRRIRELSRGNRALLALVLAMSFNPDLVLLDECTSGMDPVFRREFDRSVIDTLQESGRTVLFASHQIKELERICDLVGIVDEGKMLLQMPVEDLRASVKLLRLAIPHPADGVSPATIGLQGVVDWQQSGRELLATVREFDPLIERRLLPSGVRVLEVIDLDLEEIFVALLSDHVLHEEVER